MFFWFIEDNSFVQSINCCNRYMKWVNSFLFSMSSKQYVKWYIYCDLNILSIWFKETFRKEYKFYWFSQIWPKAKGFSLQTFIIFIHLHTHISHLYSSTHSVFIHSYIFFLFVCACFKNFLKSISQIFRFDL